MRSDPPVGCISHRNADGQVTTLDVPSTSHNKLVNFGLVTLEFTMRVCVPPGKTMQFTQFTVLVNVKVGVVVFCGHMTKLAS